MTNTLNRRIKKCEQLIYVVLPGKRAKDIQNETMSSQVEWSSKFEF